MQPLVSEVLPKAKTEVIEVHISCHFGFLLSTADSYWQRPSGLGKHSQHCVLYPRYFGFGLFTVIRTIRSFISQPRFHVRFVT